MTNPIIAVVACLLMVNGIEGPVAFELATISEARAVHEDGRDRKPGESVPGVGYSREHLALLNKIKCQIDLNHDLVTGEAASGGFMKLFRIKGEEAHTARVLLVAEVLNSYPERFGGVLRSAVWNRAKKLSACGAPCRKEYLEQTEEMKEVLLWANRAYGPGMDGYGRKK